MNGMMHTNDGGRAGKKGTRDHIAGMLLGAAWLAALAPGAAYAQAAAAGPAASTTSAATAPGFTPAGELQALFELEGESPYATPYAGTLSFSALQSKYKSGNGHGYRNELKLATQYRRGVDDTDEHFSARVTPTLPAGAKTIVAQYHAEGLDTLVKIYVQDTADSQGLDGKAGNGVFDILARIKGTDGKEVTTALGTVRSGGSFDLDIVFTHGEAEVATVTAERGDLRSGRTRIKAGGGKIYFKFGDYLQARDPATGEHTASPAKWDEYYRLNHIDSSQVRFSQVGFQRR